MYDQLGGGFARYSVDARWLVPHFEKMLYDNALLLRVYLHAVAGDRRAAVPRGSPTRRSTSCCASCARPRAASPPRSTPTPRVLLARPDLTAAARDAAGLLAGLHLPGSQPPGPQPSGPEPSGEHLADGRLIRTSRDGKAGDTAGTLEDYACVAEGFLTLSGVTGEARWLRLAADLLEVALGSFGDGAGGFYDTAAGGEALIFRPADPADNATPSGTFALAGALLSYAALTGSARHREAAVGALGVLPGIAARYPRAAGAGLSVAEAILSGPAEIAVVGALDDGRTRALHQTALHAAPPGAVLALGDGSQPLGAGDAADGGVPLLDGRGLVDGAPAAYVCRQFTCQAPVTTPEQLRAVLAEPA
jgi:uncharacterized protein YyaL (SSP411 family)